MFGRRGMSAGLGVAAEVMSRFPRIVDDVTVRLVAAVVLILTSLALAFGAWWLYLPLAFDFILRAAVGPQVSPVARAVTRWVRPRLSAARRATAGPPKRFAATVGAVMSVAILALWATGAAYPLLLVLGATMVLFPALESIFGICVGCLMFGGLIRLGLVPEEVCVECADISLRQRRIQASQA